MKRTMFSVLTVVVLTALCGCRAPRGQCPSTCMPDGCARAPQNCSPCDGCGATCDAACGDACNDPGRRHCCRLFGGRDEQPCEEQAADAAGPATGAITYPYYTTRGPRDFLAKNPPSIGP
jgi:hypothetical protein